jgi:hypothetical protein
MLMILLYNSKIVYILLVFIVLKGYNIFIFMKNNVIYI